MQKIWKFHPIDLNKQKLFSSELGISPVLAQILINRGIDNQQDAHNYLTNSLSNCYDSFLLKDMCKAQARINRAIRQKEKIVIYGDYDVDGLTSCALLFNVLSVLGADVFCYIPHRIEEGYGLNKNACVFIKKENVSLVITVDCGIGSFEEIKYLASQGIDTIITDHHRPQDDNLPGAIAVINPLQKRCKYPFKDLAGVGLAYKLAQVVTGKQLDVSEHLDLVALGTISDVASLTGENRILVKYGLKKLSHTKKVGLKALMEVAGIKKRNLSAYHVGFILGPRINAIGRMGSAKQALDLLLSKNYSQAIDLAKILDKENRQRQKEESKTLKEALAQIESEINFKHHRSLILHNDKWHPGVIGIVASRIAERFYRPTILISTKDKIGKGSGRSIRNFHLFDTLLKCDHLLEEFGGHEKAAGLSILRENLEDFKRFFNEMVHKTLSSEELIPVIDVDMEIALSALSEKLISEIEKCAPFGVGNARPVFASRDLKLKGNPRYLRSNGIKLWMTDGKITCEALGNGFNNFNISHVDDNFSILYSPSINNWQGINTIQLKLKDLQVC